MAYCFRFYGQWYLRELLNPLLLNMFEIERSGHPLSYEVDPARYVYIYLFLYDNLSLIIANLRKSPLPS